MSTLVALLVKHSFKLVAATARLMPLLIASLVCAEAGTVNITEGPPFNFRSGSDLYVSFSVWNYAANNRDSSPYPTSVGLQLLGAQPSSSALNVIPNSTNSYFSGYLLQGWLENSAGTVSSPFSNPDAVRLGLAAGSLLLEPGIFSGGTSPISVIEADAALTLNLSEQIFGPDVASRGSNAVIHLRNVGQDLQIGMDGGYSLLSAISEPSVSGTGGVTTSGITRGIQTTAVPEPGSFTLLLLTGLAVLAFCVKRCRETEPDAD
jgi:hypothetical protein